MLLCKECQDVLRLTQEEKRTCKCGKVGGMYIDSLNAKYFGELAVPIGFANGSLVQAIDNQPEVGLGENFSAFVIPVNCPTYKQITEQEFNSIRDAKDSREVTEKYLIPCIEDELDNLKRELSEKYGINTDRDLFNQLGIESEERMKVHAWIKYQCAYSYREGLLNGRLELRDTIRDFLDTIKDSK